MLRSGGGAESRPCSLHGFDSADCILFIAAVNTFQHSGSRLDFVAFFWHHCQLHNARAVEKLPIFVENAQRGIEWWNEDYKGDLDVVCNRGGYH